MKVNWETLIDRWEIQMIIFFFVLIFGSLPGPPSIFRCLVNVDFSFGILPYFEATIIAGICQ